jgi:hypothetical protein
VAIVTRADLTRLGCFKVPAEVDFGAAGVWATSYSDGPLAVRRVGSNLRFFSTVHVYSGGLVYEFDFPGLGDTIASAPTASVVKAWGDVYGSFRPVATNSAGGNHTWGMFWFPGDAHLNAGLMWSFGAYYLGQTDWPSLGLTEISGNTATPTHNWKIASYGRGYREGGAVVMPDGRLGIAGGGAARTNQGMSLGPAMFAVSTTDLAAATSTTIDGGGNVTAGSNVPYTKLIVYDQAIIAAHAPPYTTPEPFHRDNDYRPAIYGLLDQNAISASIVPLPSSDVYAIDDHYNLHPFICRGETRTIIDFDGPTRTATLSLPLSFVPQIGDGYEIPVISSAAEFSLYMWIAQGSTGYLSQIDIVGQPVWIDNGGKKAVIYPLTLLKGRAYYRPGGITIESRKHLLAIFDPAALNGSDGIAAAEIIDLADFGLQTTSSTETREEVNLAWDGVGSTLYVIENGAWGGPYDFYPVVHAIAVDLGSSSSGRPGQFGPLTSLVPGGYGGRRHESASRSRPGVGILTRFGLGGYGVRRRGSFVRQFPTPAPVQKGFYKMSDRARGSYVMSRL